MLRPIEGPAWGYRYRARLSVRYVVKKECVLVGFHERKSSYVADMGSCEVLPPHLSAMLVPLRELVAGMDQRDRLPQIEVAVGDQVTALVLRHLEPMSAERLATPARLRRPACRVQWWLQPKGPETVHLLDSGGPDLAYTLPEFGITMPFKPTDFTQANHQINRALVERALRLLDAGPDERVIDWFCGLGNFTLPIATQAREVLGIEGSEALVARSRGQTLYSMDLAGKTELRGAQSLRQSHAEELTSYGAADKMAGRPAARGRVRAGQGLGRSARRTDRACRELHAAAVASSTSSCNPATLARDAGLLVHQAGYRCVLAGAINMFPHTAHGGKHGGLRKG